MPASPPSAIAPTARPASTTARGGSWISSTIIGISALISAPPSSVGSRQQAPETYAKILEADAQSLAALGHGNAIAQAYNHAILPLAKARDRETQVIWGLKDFEHRFRRPAAAMWLPETAVNYPTLATLVDHGMKFVILSPYQAKRVRPLTGGEWTPAPGGLDTTQAYRCFLPGAGGGRPEAALHRRLFL